MEDIFKRLGWFVDRQRNPFICLLIEMYSVILIEKTRLGFTYAFFIEGISLFCHLRNQND